MLTLFATPRAFVGHMGVIQRNAITSWTRLDPRPEIILFGDEGGTAEICAELGLRHLPNVRTGPSGSPLLDDMFERAQSQARSKALCHLSADLMLLPEFTFAVERMIAWKRPFLLVSRRWNVDIRESWDFSDPSWAERLRTLASESGVLAGPAWIDLFAFSKGVFDEIPPFVVGRPLLDRWLIWRGVTNGAAVVDGTRAFTLIHQQHDYSHITGGFDETRLGPEAVRNRELAGDWSHDYTTDNARFTLGRDGTIRRAWGRPYRKARRTQAWRRFLDRTRPMRRTALGRWLNAAAKRAARLISLAR